MERCQRRSDHCRGCLCLESFCDQLSARQPSPILCSFWGASALCTPAQRCSTIAGPGCVWERRDHEPSSRGSSSSPLALAVLMAGNLNGRPTAKAAATKPAAFWRRACPDSSADPVLGQSTLGRRAVALGSWAYATMARWRSSRSPSGLQRVVAQRPSTLVSDRRASWSGSFWLPLSSFTAPVRTVGEASHFRGGTTVFALLLCGWIGAYLGHPCCCQSSAMGSILPADCAMYLPF